MTFFPINILIVPFIIPVLGMRNKRVSDFALKSQYIVMICMYMAVVLMLIIPMLPILYLKSIVNNAYVSWTNSRQDYKYQNISTMIITIFFGPIISIGSVVIDLISIPGVLLMGSKNFEHKYQLSQDRMNDK